MYTYKHTHLRIYTYAFAHTHTHTYTFMQALMNLKHGENGINMFAADFLARTGMFVCMSVYMYVVMPACMTPQDATLIS